ncbi:MAG: 50S ribosomal protein L27 [Candidatus Ryanbacteria bacterium RIFCSPHIGHO2_02_FULL_45_13b]|uniref:Large ribosomal subunit protein bL27 n=1 Tax=Candidatus Ryanbacteria bacterium RIFCSPHIGHO2_02_FULL_45_13b TaxID=1802117 RepID=A0A1G2G9E0_9BACT|nr:MAG: 50S ribosomal protein L27 [Candidatus Ryanbacteria bacterium RIFCSPHIGHO2_02_FULL_45_13b]
MAHTKSAGSTANVRDSQPKYRGVKIHDGDRAIKGNIIVRQVGSRILPGAGVRQGSDFTLYAVRNGIVKFSSKRKKRFDGAVLQKKVVSVV